MIEYGTGSHTTASPSLTCYYPRWPELDVPQELCDRTSGHLGRHAAWRLGGKTRVYWERGKA